MTASIHDPALGRNDSIDALRGLSILLVIFHHLDLRIPLAKTWIGSLLPDRLIEALVQNGYQAVFVFFVISGYLITQRSNERWPSLTQMPASHHYARRFARIAPCLLVLLTILSLLHLAGVGPYVINGENQTLTGAIFSALTFQLNWYEGKTGWLPGAWDVLWSLSIEELFYLAFPLFFICIRAPAFRIVLLALLALSLPISKSALSDVPIWQEKAYLPGMSAIAIGVLTALLPPCRTPRARASSILVGAVGIAAVLLYGAPLWRAVGETYLLVLTIAVATWLWGAAARRPASRFDRGRRRSWSSNLGRFSYEVYLTHMFVVFALAAIYDLTKTSEATAWVYYPVCLVCCYILGKLVAIGFSNPSEKRIRHWLLDRRIGAIRPHDNLAE